MNQPRILLLDIETAPHEVYVWDLFDQNIAHEQIREASYILCWSAKWLNDGYTEFHCDWQHKRPKAMLQRMHKLLDIADIVVHFNGTRFDIPTLNKEFIINNFTPPSPYKQVDLYKVCKSKFRFSRNSMNHVASVLGLEHKIKHEGFMFWVKCMEGDSEAQARMTAYNQQDVRVLEQEYLRMRPWIEKHPNLGAYSDKPACSNCGSKRVQRRGQAVAINRWHHRYHCQACGKWFTGEVVKNESR